ncbi:MAG: hypothetical protein Tsb002_27580 [Wenzhouxiangellaceae bacterium]
MRFLLIFSLSIFSLVPFKAVAQSWPLTDINYGICPDANILVSGAQRVYRDTVTNLYLDAMSNNPTSPNLINVWLAMDAATRATLFQGYPAGTYMMNNFLHSRGDVELDYTAGLLGMLDLPIILLQPDWVSEATAVTQAYPVLDTQATIRAQNLYQFGIRTGIIEFSTPIETNSATDPDLYFALGKFELTGTYSFRYSRPWGQRPHLKLERIYDAGDVYDWDPPRQCGILDHVIPWALVQEGYAADFDVSVIWSKDVIEIPLAYANCTEARDAGVAPILLGEPGYGYHLDRDDDGIACE